MELQAVPLTSPQAAVTHIAASRLASSGLAQAGIKWAAAPAENTEEEAAWECPLEDDLLIALAEPRLRDGGGSQTKV